MNKIFLSGNLTQAPEVKYTQNGRAYARCSVAVKRPFSKESKDAVDFFNFIAWEKTAEIMGKYLFKGSRVLIEGRLKTSSYEKNGAKVNSIDIVIENIEFADGKKKAAVDDEFKGEAVDEADVPF